MYAPGSLHGMKVGKRFVPLNRLEAALLYAALGVVGGVVLFNGIVVVGQLAVALAFCIYVATLCIVLAIGLREGGWFHPLVFTVVWWELLRRTFPKLGVYWSGLESHPALWHLTATGREIVVIASLLLSALGLAAMVVGYRIGRRIPAPSIEFAAPRTLRTKVFIVAAFSIVSLVVLAYLAGGPDQLLMQRGLPRSERVAARVGAHWIVGINLLRVACLIWLAFRPRSIGRPDFIAVVLLSAGASYLSTGSRGSVVALILMLLMVWSLRTGSLPRMRIVLAGLAALFIVGFLGDIRSQTFRASSAEDVRINTDVGSHLGHGIEEFVSYGTAFDGTYAVLGNVSRFDDLLLGVSYLSILFAPLPSALLPFEKPPAGGALTSAYFFNNPSNTIPPGAVGEAYWNFHTPGVVIVHLVFGLFLGAIAKLYQSHSGSGWITVVYVLTLLRLQPSSDGFYTWFHSIAPAILLLILFCGFPRLKTRGQLPTAAAPATACSPSKH